MPSRGFTPCECIIVCELLAAGRGGDVTKFCATVCKVFEGGCDPLFKACMRLSAGGFKQAADTCLQLYLDLCFGW